MRTRTKWLWLVVIIVAVLGIQGAVFADEPTNNQVHYCNELHKIDEDKGFSLDEEQKIKEKDLHYCPNMHD